MQSLSIYIVAMIQFIGFSSIIMRLENVQEKLIIQEKLENKIKEIKIGLNDLEYLNKENFTCFKIVILLKSGKEKQSENCLCFYSEIYKNSRYRIPYNFRCNEIPKHWKNGGVFE